jgi:hypothetical protein
VVRCTAGVRRASSSRAGLRPRGRRRALERLHGTFVRLSPLLRGFPPREPGAFCVPARRRQRSRRARVAGTAGGFQQRTAQEAIRRECQASRAEARRQPRLSRAAPRAAQRAVARQVAIGCRLSRAARACTPGQDLRPQRRAAPAAARRAGRRLRHLPAVVPARALRRSLPRDATRARAPVRQVQHRTRPARRGCRPHAGGRGLPRPRPRLCHRPPRRAGAGQAALR